MLLLSSDIVENLKIALTNVDLWINIAKTIIFIFMGFLFTKKKWLPDETGKILTKFVMIVCLPCLAFCSFMTDFTAQGGIDAIVNFILGFVLYILFIFLGKLIFIWVKDPNKKLVLSVLFAFGSTTFLAYPLISSIYGNNASNNFNIMNVAYRVFVYSYAYLSIAGIKIGSDEKSSVQSIIKKVILNPIIIATFAGLILWILQIIPNINTVRVDWLSVNDSISYSEIKKVAFFRIDVTLPWIYYAGKTLGSLASPIILFAIGCTLASTSLKDAAKDKYAWIWSGLKIIVAPTIVLGILLLIEVIGRALGQPEIISMDTLNSSIITWMMPPATVAVGYCINFDKEKEMASHISLIGTLCAIVGIIVWVIVLTVIGSTGFFV